jgi:hypothetical protein
VGRGTRAGWAAWSVLALALLGLLLVGWLDTRLRAAGRSDLAVLVPSNIPPLFAALSAVTVGAVVASRRPRHPSGWLLLLLGAALTLAAVGLAEVSAAVAGLGSSGWLAPYLPVAILIAVDCTAFLLLLTPSGSLPSPRWRPWAAVTAVIPAVVVLVVALTHVRGAPVHHVTSPLDLRALSAAEAVIFQVAFVICQVANLVATISLVVRFRRARGVERQQLRWLVLATGVVLALSAVVVAGVLSGAPVLAGLVGGLCPAVLSGAIGAAVLRYRLYDLDRIISRTLAYGLLTVLLGGSYAVVVLGIGQWLASGSSLVVAGATLAVAAAFRPAQRRVQAAVDRRFNRRRYDGARTIEAFSARMRDHVDLDSLTGRLLGVVEQSMQPASVSLWLRPSGGDQGRPAAEA